MARFVGVGVSACVALLLIAAAHGGEGAGSAQSAGAADGAGKATTTRPAGAAPNGGPVNYGPDVVILKELVALYEPVPFDHKGHAKMAEMWDGCKTCHHRTPDAATQPAGAPAAANGTSTANGPGGPKQDDAHAIPACKSCHPVADGKVDIHTPSLKGAYHRQCLNCHREWSGANDCVICHKPRGEVPAGAPMPTSAPSPDDIIGRMHPPLSSPTELTYRTRFTPADGPNVLFRHAEHIHDYGLKCVNCHRRDSCRHCHAPKPGANDVPVAQPELKILKPHETWGESHRPCIGCHVESRCKTCHFKDGQLPPPRFEHLLTGQALDTDHEKLTCGQCHTTLRSRAELTCGGAACHKRGEVVAYPRYRPGPVVATQPSIKPAARAGAGEGMKGVGTDGVLRPVGGVVR